MSTTMTIDTDLYIPTDAPIQPGDPCPKCGRPTATVDHMRFSDDHKTVCCHNCRVVGLTGDTVWVKVALCENDDPTPFLRNRAGWLAARDMAARNVMASQADSGDFVFRATTATTS
jgi:hypothetical protein